VRALLAPLSALLLSCGGVQFEVTHGPDFAGWPRTVSIFGVYKDGRMSLEGWNDLGRPFSSALGKDLCDALYSQELRAADPRLAMSIDEATQNEGISEAILDKLGAFAEGEAIVVVSMRTRGGRRPLRASASANVARRRDVPVSPIDGDGEIHLAATLYSPSQHVPIGRVDMTYPGSNTDEAVQKFVVKVRETLGGTVCKGWKVGAPKAP